MEFPCADGQRLGGEGVTLMPALAWHRLQDLRQPGPRSVAPSIIVGFSTHWFVFSQPGQSGCAHTACMLCKLIREWP